MKSFFRRPISLTVCLVLACSFAKRCEAGDSQWVEVKSPHFSVVTDTGDKRGREVAMRFEQMRAVFAVLMPKANVNITIPLQIVAFRNTKEFRAFAPLWHGKPTELAGLFQGGEDRSFIMLDMSVEDPYQVVFHEYAHQLMNGNLARAMDPWFEEGFAEFFSSIEVDSKQARVGKIPDQTYLVLQQNGMMKVADLLQVRHNTSTYNESGDHRTVFYRQSWMVVHYLYDTQQILKLNAYFDARSKQASVDEALQQAFGMNAAQFDNVLKKYVNGGSYKYFAIPNPPSIVSGSFTAAPLSAADVATITADIHLHSIDYQEKAIAEFQEILKADPASAAANRGLGYAFLRQKRYNDAKEYFRKASQLDSKDPLVHYYSALMISQDGTFSGESDLSEVAQELETAIALDPSYADAYMLLGFTRMRQGASEKGVEAMEKAASLRPRDERYRYNLAQIYLSSGNYDRATVVLHGLESSSDPLMVSRAQQSLQQLQIMSSAPARVPHMPGTPTGSSDPGQPSPSHSVTIVLPPGHKGPIVSRDLQGTITAVRCGPPPTAHLTMVAESKTWDLLAEDVDDIILTGAKEISCAWTNQKAAAHFVIIGDAEGILMTLSVK